MKLFKFKLNMFMQKCAMILTATLSHYIIADSEYLHFSAEETFGPRISIENTRRLRPDLVEVLIKMLAECAIPFLGDVVHY